MLTVIRKFLNTFFLVVLLLLSAPTLIFLTKSYYSNLVTKKTYIGVIDVPRVVEKSEEITNAAKTLLASSDVRGIILKCDGIGGNAGACQAIHSDIIKLKQAFKKPILAYIEDYSFGGSYFIACAADFIISANGSKIGLFSDFLSRDQRITEQSVDSEEIKIKLRNQLKEGILVRRPAVISLTIESLEKSLLTGENAKELGLIDFVGGNLEVEKVMRSKTVIEGLIEKVHGSFLEHFIFYVSDLVRRIIQGFSVVR